MLAEKLGMTVEELLGRISSYELTEWMKFYEIRQKEEERERKKARHGKGTMRG